NHGKNTLWYRSFDSQSAQELPGTEGAIQPFWSADSHSIAFFAQGKLRKIQISGGPSQDLCEALDPRGGAWNGQDIIIYSSSAGAGLYRVSASGGTPVRLTSVDKSSGEMSQRFPSFLPDGIHYLYFSWSQSEIHKQGVYLGSLDSQ